LQAALQGNVEQCKYYLNMDIDLSKKDIWGCNALHAAAKGGSQAVVRKLLASGLKVDEPDSWDETALHIAARNGHAEVCETLLAFGATLNTRNAQHMTPLLIAGHAGHEAVCRLLVGLGLTLQEYLIMMCRLYFSRSYQLISLQVMTTSVI